MGKDATHRAFNIAAEMMTSSRCTKRAHARKQASKPKEIDRESARVRAPRLRTCCCSIKCMDGNDDVHQRKKSHFKVGDGKFRKFHSYRQKKKNRSAIYLPEGRGFVFL